MSSLFRLVYYSRNRLPGGGPAGMAAAVAQILEASRRNNAGVDVSGALMFNAGCFGQVLEGPRDAVEATFERIQQDDRHGDVAVLAFGPVEARSFENWSMAFVGGSDEGAAEWGGIAGTSGFDPSRVSADELADTLRRLVREEEQLAA